ncbi:hypothetical protein BGZ73_001099, partial [Actinomortierella ambigua]
LVNTYLTLGRAEEALQAAKDARRELPESSRAQALYGTTLFHLGGAHATEHDHEGHEGGGGGDQEATALNILREAYHRDPTCSEAAWGLVMVLEHQKQYAQALAVLDELLDGAAATASQHVPTQQHVMQLQPLQQQQQQQQPQSSSSSSSNPLFVSSATGSSSSSSSSSLSTAGAATAFPTPAPLVSVVRIHLRKAELYNGMANWEQCYLSYQRALVLDPANEEAKAGMAPNEEEEEEEEAEEGDLHRRHHHRMLHQGLSLESDGRSPVPPRAPAPSRIMTVVPTATTTDVEMEDPFAAPAGGGGGGGSSRHGQTRGGRRGSRAEQQEQPSPEGGGAGGPVFSLRRRVTYSPPFHDEDDDGDEGVLFHPAQQQQQPRQRRLPQPSHQQQQQPQQLGGSSPGSGRGVMMRDGRTPFPRSPSISSPVTSANGGGGGTMVIDPSVSTPGSVPVPVDFESMTPAQRRQMRYAAERARRGGDRGGGGGGHGATTNTSTPGPIGTSAGMAVSPPFPHTPSLAAAARQQQQQQQQLRRQGRQGASASVGGTGGGSTMVTPRRGPPTATIVTAAQREREYDELESEQM